MPALFVIAADDSTFIKLPAVVEYPTEELESSSVSQVITACIPVMEETCTLEIAGFVFIPPPPSPPPKTYGNIVAKDGENLPCCNIYRPYTDYIAAPCVNPVNDVIADNKFPWWGLWRTENSAPLPEVFYPSPIQPESLCDPNRQW